MRKRARVTTALLATVVAGSALTAVVAGGGTALAATPSYDFANPETIATGLTVPWGMDFLPDGSALVAERNSGRILRITPGQAPQTVTTISGVSASGESGLLGLAVSPTFAQDELVYVYFTTASDNRIVRFRLSAPATQAPILTGLARATIHDGGRIAFGPDGNLYAGVGDAAVTSNAQNQSSLNGKILRMRPDGTVPTGNPFNTLVYSLGHRNVQGLAWDSAGRLYASEFGQNTWDEVNLIVAGGNYGWPTVEGTSSNTAFRNPLVTWPTSQASPSGAAISGDTLYVAALAGTRLWTVPLNGSGGVGTPVAVLQGQYGRLRTVELAPDGTLWVSTSNRDGRGSPASTDDRIFRFRPTGGTTTPPTTRPTTPPTTRPTTPPTTPPTTRPTTPPTTPPTTRPTTPPTTPPTAGVGCTATYRVTGQWNGGFQGEVTVQNTGTTATTGWAVSWTFTNGQAISQVWGGTYTPSGSAVTVRNAAWNGNLAPNASTTFGFIGSWSGSNPVPAPVTCAR